MVCVECCTTRVVCCMVCVERCTMRVVCCMVCVATVACCVLYATFQNDSVCSPTISAYAVYSAAATEGCPFHLRDAIQRTISTCPTRRVPARLRRTRMHKHACTPERRCYCLLNGSGEFVTMIGSIISACQFATVCLQSRTLPLYIPANLRNKVRRAMHSARR